MAVRSPKTAAAFQEPFAGLPTGDRRLLVFAALFPPHVGGVEKFTRQLWSRLATRGWTVVILTTNSNRVAPYEHVGGLHVFRLPMIHTVSDRYPIPTPGKSLRLARKALAAWAPHFVVTNTRFYVTSVMGIRFARRHGIPSLHVDHGTQHIEIGGVIGGAISAFIDHTIGAWVVRHADRCVGVSGAVVEFLAHLGRRDAGVLHNGVDTAAFAQPQSNWREKLDIPSADRVILYVGRMIEDKGVPDLLEAYESLDPGPGVHLILAGEGPFVEKAKERTASRHAVHVLGGVPGEEIAALMAAADVFAHPSAYPEGLPTAVLEAAAAGLPIVATPKGGTEEIVCSPDHGVIVRPHDTEALGQALQRLLSDGELCRRMGTTVQQHVREVFDWERIADEAEAELSALEKSNRPVRGNTAPHTLLL